MSGGVSALRPAKGPLRPYPFHTRCNYLLLLAVYVSHLFRVLPKLLTPQISSSMKQLIFVILLDLRTAPRHG